MNIPEDYADPAAARSNSAARQLAALIRFEREQLRLQVEALSSDVDARLDELAALTIPERLARLRVALPELLDWLAPGEPVVEGAVAAIVQGAPIDATMLNLSVARDRLDEFAKALMRFPPARWNERWQDYGVSSSDPRLPGPMRWRSHLGEFTLRVVDTATEFLTVRMEQGEMRVRPLAEVEIDDPAVREQLGRFRRRTAAHLISQN